MTKKTSTMKPTAPPTNPSVREAIAPLTPFKRSAMNSCDPSLLRSTYCPSQRTTGPRYGEFGSSSPAGAPDARLYAPVDGEEDDDEDDGPEHHLDERLEHFPAEVERHQGGRQQPDPTQHPALRLVPFRHIPHTLSQPRARPFHKLVIRCR